MNHDAPAGANEPADPVRPLDPGRINTMDPVELAWWCRELDCSEERLRAAVDEVGEHAAAVRERLAAH